MKCPKCGSPNDEDAKYCEKCRFNIQKSNYSGNIIENKGMSTSTKALIVLCILIVGVLGVTAGFMFQNTSSDPDQALSLRENSTPKTEQAPKQTTYQPTWHKVNTFTGPGNEYRSFSIKGNKFKVTMSAVPMINYDYNYLDVFVYRDGYVIDSGFLSWGPRENPGKKEHVIQVSNGPGMYEIIIAPIELESHTVTVWDYY